MRCIYYDLRLFWDKILTNVFWLSLFNKFDVIIQESKKQLKIVHSPTRLNK